MGDDAVLLMTGDGEAVLDKRLSDELDAYNRVAAAAGEQRELTVRAEDAGGALVAGLSGWSWGTSAGIAMLWVREDRGRSGLGARLLATAEPVAGVAGETGLERLPEALEAYHLAWELTVEHDPDAAPVLRRLRDRGLVTGLLSNTHWPRDLHERWLADAGLLDLLDARVCTSDLQHVKPHPEAFGALLRAVGVAAEAAVFVGDRPRDDVWEAQRSGLRAVLLTGRPVEPWDVEPDASLPGLAGLVEVVDRWR